MRPIVKLIFVAIIIHAAICSWGVTVTSIRNNCNPCSSLTATGLSGISANGDLLVAIVGQGTNNTATASLSDNTGSNTWVQAGSYVNNGTTERFGMFYAANITAVSTVTVGWGSSLSLQEIVVFDITGMATGSPLDGTPATSHNGTAASLTSGSLTTTNANDVLVYGVYARNNLSSGFTAGTGFTIPSSGSGTQGGMQYEVVSSTQSAVTTSMSWTTNSGANDGVFAAFKEAGGGGTPFFAPRVHVVY